MAYTERPAILQFFQILMLSVSLGLEAYAYNIDVKWKKGLQRHGRRYICLWLIREIDFHMFKTQYSDPAVEDAKKEVNYDKIFADDINYFDKSIKRGASGEERAALIIMSVSIVLLIIHLVLACVSKHRSYRTKWTATVQGIMVFSCAFSAIFMAISAHNYETAYHDLSVKFPECTLLHACNDGMYKDDEKLGKFLNSKKFKNDTKSIHLVQHMLNNESVCQEFQFKIAAAIICGVVILLSLIVICNAMDLTTLYDEEEVDEEEHKRRQVFHMHALHAKRRMHGVVSAMNIHEEETIEKDLEKLESERLLTPRNRKSVFS